MTNAEIDKFYEGHSAKPAQAPIPIPEPEPEPEPIPEPEPEPIPEPEPEPAPVETGPRIPSREIDLNSIDEDDD
jgi:outer membrane biosynthesis protein TonB